MSRLTNIVRAFGAAFLATAGIVGFGTAFPKLALGFAIAGAALAGLGINLPQSTKDLAGMARAIGVALGAVAAVTGFTTSFPKAAMGVGAASAFMLCLGVSLSQPAPAPAPAPPAPGGGS